jgi:hypothetical protein
MSMNLFQLEQQMRTEVAARRHAAEQIQQAHAAHAQPLTPDTRILLRAGRLRLTWTPR